MDMASRTTAAPFIAYGRGRPWPLLTGERGHYELAAGRDVQDLPSTRLKPSRMPRACCPSKSGISPTFRRSCFFMGKSNRRGDAADVGARGIYQAAALDGRRQSLRFDSRSLRALLRQSPAPTDRDGNVEIQSPAEIGAPGQPVADPGPGSPSSCIGRATNGAPSTTPPRR